MIKYLIIFLVIISFNTHATNVDFIIKLKSKHGSHLRLFYTTDSLQNFSLKNKIDFYATPGVITLKRITLPETTRKISINFYNIEQIDTVEFYSIIFIYKQDTLIFNGLEIINQFDLVDVVEIFPSKNIVVLNKSEKGGKNYSRLTMDQISHKRYEEFIGIENYQYDTIAVSIKCLDCDLNFMTHYKSSRGEIDNYSSLKIKGDYGQSHLFKIPILHSKKIDVLSFSIINKTIQEIEIEYLIINLNNSVYEEFNGRKLIDEFSYSDSLSIRSKMDNIVITAPPNHYNSNYFGPKYSYSQTRNRIFFIVIIPFILVALYFFNTKIFTKQQV